MATEHEAVTGPVERHVRPCAWRWAFKKLRGQEWRYTNRLTRLDAQPLYDQAAIDAAVSAERERCAGLVETWPQSARHHSTLPSAIRRP